MLVEYFVQLIGRNKKNPLRGFDQTALRALTAFPWRGNVRELENLIQHMTILHGGAQVGFNDLPEKYRNGGQPQPGLCSPPSPPEDVTRPEQLLLFSPAAVVPQESWPDSGIDFNALVNDFETQLIVQALKFTQGNKKEAARLLNLKRTTLLEKIKKKELFGNLPDDDESE